MPDLRSAVKVALVRLGLGDRRCPRRPRLVRMPRGRICARPHCDRCGGHDPILDKPGDFAVCQPCRNELDAEYNSREEAGHG